MARGTGEPAEKIRVALEDFRGEESIVTPRPGKEIVTNLRCRWREPGTAFRYLMLLAYAMAFSMGALLGTLE